MCEFCSFGPNTNHDRESTNPIFSGFFTSDAIDAAVRLATEQRKAERRQRDSQRKQKGRDEDDQLRDNSRSALASPDGSESDAAGIDEEDGQDEEDEDGT